MNTFVIVALIIVIILALSPPLHVSAVDSKVVNTASKVATQVEHAANKGAKKGIKAGKKLGKKLRKRSTWQSVAAKLKRNPTINRFVSNIAHSSAYKTSAIWWRRLVTSE